MKLSLDIGNSTIIGATEQGTRIIRSLVAIQKNDDSRSFGSEDTPVITIQGVRYRIGADNLELKHHSLAEGAKESYGLLALATVVPAAVDRLHVLVSHYDLNTAHSIAKDLTGTLEFVLDRGLGPKGYRFPCTAEAVTEGEGAFALVRDRLKPGSTVVVEIGLGTVEILPFSSQGRQLDYKSYDFGVKWIIDRLIETAPKTLKNRALIESYIEQGTEIPGWPGFPEQLNMYVRTWFSDLRAKIHEHCTDSVGNLVFSGGGAALVRRELPNSEHLILFPENPRTASAVGALKLGA